MATFVIYADATDGYINSSSATYSTARSGGGTLSAVTGAFNTYVGQYYSGPTSYIYEAFLQFDTSSVSGTVNTAVLSVYLAVNEGTAFTANARAYDWGTALTTADFIAGGSLSGNALRASLATSGLSVEQYVDFTSDSSFASNVASPVRLALSSSRTESNTAPSGPEDIAFYPADNTGTTKDPKLTITTADPNPNASDGGTVSDSASVAFTRVVGAVAAADFCDTLNGTDGTNLESHTPTGPLDGVAASGSWTQWYPTSGFPRLRLTSNKLYSYTSSAIATTAEYRHSQQILDGEFSADVSIPGAHNDGGYVVMSLRHAGAAPGSGSGYQLYFSNGAYVTAGTLRLDATVGGSSTALGNYTIGTLTPGTAYRVTLVVVGDQISVKLNGVTVLGPFTDTSVTAGGYVHLGISSPDGASTSVGVQVDDVLVRENAKGQEAASVSEGSPFVDAVTKVAADTATAADSSTGLLVSPQPVAASPQTRSVYGSPTTLFPSNGVVGTHGAHYGLQDGITLPDGTQVVVARKATAHSAWDGSFVAKTRAPGGSWSAEATILNTAYDERDPSLGLLADGTLCMTWNRLEVNGTYGVGDDDYVYAPFSTCPAGLDPLVAANWTTPVHITGTGLANNWRVGTDILELTPGGRIVVALYGTPTYPPWTDNQCWIAYTDDGGTTWGMLSLLDNGNAHALSSSGEAQLALCSDGSVLAIYRTISSPWETWARRSTDGCATWSAEWRVAQNSVNKTGMIRTPDGDHLICFGLNASTLAFSQSWDDGDTFATPTDTGLSANLYTQPFSIGPPAVTPNVAVVYAVENGAQNLASVYYVELTRGATQATQSEVVAVSESASVSGASTTSKSASDTAAVTDTASALLTFSTIPATEAVSVADAASLADVLTSTASDVFVFTEPLVQAFEVEGVSITVHPQGMAPGTAIGAYLRWEWRGPVAAKLNAGPGAVVKTTTVGDDLTATFLGLDPGEYVAYAPAYPTKRLFFMVTE